MLPANIKKGIAIKGKESTPATQFWLIITNGTSENKTKAIKVAMPMA
jgi:negative regulator of replication initiation